MDLPERHLAHAERKMPLQTLNSTRRARQPLELLSKLDDDELPLLLRCVRSCDEAVESCSTMSIRSPGDML